MAYLAFHGEFEGITDVPEYSAGMLYIRSYDFPMKSIYNDYEAGYNKFMDECVDAVHQAIEWMCQSRIFKTYKDQLISICKYLISGMKEYDHTKKK